MTLADLVPDPFILRAALAGGGLALAAGPLGCFVVWRRMAYFGDAMAHTALLGVALGLVLGVGVTGAIAVVGVALALGLSTLMRHRRLSADALLGIFSHGALAAGLVTLALVGTVRVDLHAYLFGDILAVGLSGLIWIWGAAALALVALALVWRPLLAATVNRDMALAEGLPVARAEAVLLVILALVVAAAIQVVGALLTTALLVMPASAARPFARGPEVMAGLAVLLGGLAVAGGLALSLVLDTPAGPSIVLAAAALFALAWTAAAIGGRAMARRRC